MLAAKPALVALLSLRGGLEAPAPGAATALLALRGGQMPPGMDPQQMAQMGGGGMPGQQQGTPPAPGATLKFNLMALFVVYLANNWKLVLVVQDIILKMLSPFLNSAAARKEEQAKVAAADAAAAARRARAARLKAAKSKAAAADDDE